MLCRSRRQSPQLGGNFALELVARGARFDHRLETELARGARLVVLGLGMVHLPY